MYTVPYVMLALIARFMACVVARARRAGRRPYLQRRAHDSVMHRGPGIPRHQFLSSEELRRGFRSRRLDLKTKFASSIIETF